MELRNLNDLFIHELKDLYSAEDQLLETLPKFAEAASNKELKDIFYQYINETEAQIRRLEDIFRNHNQEPEVEECLGMRGIIKEAHQLLEKTAEPNVLDAALIAVTQRIAHYEIADYGCARTYAKFLGDDWSAEQLQTSLKEESRVDAKMTQLAERVINIKAPKLSI
jgi:ferritin-like metal-binding protein YciE